MIQINLLPDIKIEYLRSQSSKQKVTAAAILVTMGALALSGLLFFYVFVVQAAQVALIDNEIKSNYSKINKIKDLDKYLTVQNQLSALTELHESKGTLSRLQNYLAALNPGAPNNVGLRSVSIDTESKTLSMQGGAGSYESFNVFVDTLRNAKVEYTLTEEKETALMFDDIAIESSNIASDKGNDVNFSLTLTYNEVIFDTRATNILPKVPTIKTTQSITNSPDVFDTTEGDN